VSEEIVGLLAEDLADSIDARCCHGCSSVEMPKRYRVGPACAGASDGRAR
jgi:hypothetical protein